MTLQDFSKRILHTIERDRIAPLPRWIFFVRQIALIGGFLLATFIGGISVSVILFSLSNIDEGARHLMRLHPGPFLITYLPYLWVLLLIAFGAIAYYDIRNMKGAYRYRTATMIAASIIASLVIGGIMHIAGAGRIAERRFAQLVPHYEGFDIRRRHLWMRPQEGMLAGTIIAGAPTTTFMLEDFAGQRWTVDATTAAYRGVPNGTSGDQVRIMGTMMAPAMFRATEIFPWVPYDGFSMRERIPAPPSY